MARRYSRAAGSKVKRVMEERKHGTLRSGSGKKVTSRKQAIAIGLSEARRAGERVPAKKSAGGGRGRGGGNNNNSSSRGSGGRGRGRRTSAGRAAGASSRSSRGARGARSGAKRGAQRGAARTGRSRSRGS